MARNQIVSVGSTWTALSDTGGAISSITLCVRGTNDVEIMATAAASAPAADVEGIVVPQELSVINRTLADLFPGVTSPAYVYGRIPPTSVRFSGTETAKVFVSHA